MYVYWTHIIDACERCYNIGNTFLKAFSFLKKSDKLSLNARAEYTYKAIPLFRHTSSPGSKK